MSRADALLTKLKNSLPKPTPVAKNQTALVDKDRSLSAPVHTAVVASITPSETERVVAGDPRPKPARIPLCFSVYESDMSRLDEIKEFMRSKGYRSVTTSEALRLACRAVEVNDRFITVFEQMRREDGRRK
jgi:hypothetical protein